MRVRVRLFSMLREMAGTGELEVELPGRRARVEQVVQEALRASPGLARAVRVLEERGLKPVVMVNGRQAGPGDEVSDGDEVAILPPASGGRAEARVVEGRVSLDKLVEEISSRASREGAGALVVFVGFVKGVVEGSRVLRLEYEAYEPAASRTLREIAEKHAAREGVTDVVVYHRVGGLEPGEPTIYVLVAARDRRTAFRVAADVLEEVKHRAPIFKLERRSDGDYWVLGDGVRVPRKLGEVRPPAEAVGAGDAGEA